MPGADGGGFGRTSLSHGPGKTARERMDAPVTRRSLKNSCEAGLVEPSYNPGFISHRLPPITSRGKKLPGAGRLPEAQAKALARTREYRKAERPDAEARIEVPIQQVRQMFQGRMQSIVMQNRQQVRELFRTWDRDNRGELNADQFHKLLLEFGVECNSEQAAEILGKFANTKPGCITFGEFFFELMGFPHDFFTMNLCDAKPEEEGQEKTQIRPLLPADTSMSKVIKIFETRLRKMLFNVEAVVNQIFERSSTTKKAMNKDDFWTMMNANGIKLTGAELEQIFSYYDLNCDGLILYYELAHELLKLPRPSANSHQQSWHHRRPQLPGRAQSLVTKLRYRCERAAAPPSALYQLFKTYDEDGSGCIAYDELQELVRETGCGVKGKDIAAILLDKYSKGTGEIPYMMFITNVLELQPDALQPPQKPGCIEKPRAATPEIVQKVSSGVKSRIYNSKDAVKRAFKLFDKEGSGECRIAEFMQGVKQLGLPISPAQMRHLFLEFSGGNGSAPLPVTKLAHELLKAAPTAQPGQAIPMGTSRSMRSTRQLPGPFTPHNVAPPHLLDMHPKPRNRTPPDDARASHGLTWQSTQQLGRRRAHSTTPGYTPHTHYEYLERNPKRAQPITARSGFSLAKLRY